VDGVTTPEERPKRTSWIVRLLDEAILDNPELRKGHRLRSVVVLALILLLLMVAVPVLLTLVREHDSRVASGVIFVVVLGAGGLVCRGIGEHRTSSAWKATGYFLGAAAYGATATVALVNGLHTLLRGS